jgi:predicted PurR-regulated permease PerM
MTLALTVAIMGPFALVGFSLVEQVRDTARVIKQAVGTDPFSLTPWLNKVPIIAARLAEYYRNFLGGEISVVEQLKRLSGPVGRTILEWSRALGNGLWELCLSLLIGFFFFRDGEVLGARIGNLATRIAGPQRGTRLLRLAQDTCVGVVYGVVGTGIIHAVLMGIGLLIAGFRGHGPGFSDLPAVRVAGWGSTDLDTCGDLVVFTKPRRLGAVPLDLGADLQFPGRWRS